MPRLVHAAENEIINVATLFLGLIIGSTMTASSFLTWNTLKILVLGLLAFGLDTAAGLLLVSFSTHCLARGSIP